MGILAGVSIVKFRLMGWSKCEMMSKESIEKTYCCVYDCLNKLMDLVRKIVLMHDFPELVRCVIGLLFVITFGPYFSTLSLMVITFNMFILSCFTVVSSKVKELSTVAIELSTKIVNDAIPKYKETN